MAISAPHVYQQATFILSAKALSQLPADIGAEIAFAGYSNVGKSSILNVLTQQQKLARTSKMPGCTQQINVFALDPGRRLIDLPGYGYAKVAQQTKQAWQQLLDSYLQTRNSLKGIILVMDIRHPLKPVDQLMLKWAAMSHIPICLLLNKVDKLNKSKARATFYQVQQATKAYKNLISVQFFSALRKQGIVECHHFLEQHLKS